MGSMGHDEVVFLLPGFMGFDALNDFQYFVDRAGVTLRTALYARTGIDVPVISLATPPTASLADRQEFLRTRLVQYLKDDLLRGCRKVHLVGHSTGGVDAWLLLCDEPLAKGSHRRDGARFGGTWGAFEHVAGLIGSVVAISAPFYGSGITLSPALQLIGDFPRGVCRNRRGLVVLGQALIDLERRACDWGSGPSDLLVNALIDGRSTLRFVGDVARDRALVDDLLPERMDRLMRESAFPEGRTVTCFASVAPPPRAPSTLSHRERAEQSLYRLCHDEIRRAGTKDFGAQARRNLALLNGETGAPVPVIGNPQETPRPFGMTDSDGIVNTGAMIPAKGGVLGGLVFGDHADVIGHYDRSRDDDDPKGFQRKADTGLLDSGSGFQDDAFFQLYRAVADAIHPGPRTTARTPPKPRPAR